MKAVLSLLVLLCVNPLFAKPKAEVIHVNEKTTSVYYVMTTLLKEEFVNVEDKATQCHLVHLASSIVETKEAEKTIINETRFIALGFNESRLGVKDYPKGKITKSNMGACGIFQQIPKFSEMPKVSCKEYNVSNSVKSAVLTLKKLVQRYSDKNLNNDICHYFSGNKCDKEAEEYAKQHAKVKAKADTLIKQVPKGFKMPKPTCKGFVYKA